FDGIWDIEEGQSYPYFKEPRVLVGLEIEGPSEVAEDSQIHYKAIAYYDIGNPKDVTASADWSVEPNDNCGIAAGLLSTERIDLPTDVAIAAQYSEGDINKIAEQNVSILAICPSGSALKFDGVDDYVKIKELVIETREFTVLAWAKYFGPGGGNYNTNMIFSQRDNRTGDNYSIVNLNAVNYYSSTLDYAHKASFQIRSSSGPLQRISVSKMPEDKWYFYAGTVDNDMIGLYINGQLVESQKNLQLGDYNISIDHICIGKDKYGSSSPAYFNGIIDKVSIFDKALSAEEIQGLMHSRPDADDPNLVGYWGFDEGEGQVAGDSSVYDNDGQLGSTPDEDNNDPVWVASDAPVGICSLEGIVERNLSDVWDTKVSILEQLYEVMAKEQALVDYMDEKFADRDFGDTSKGDVAKAKQKIHSAIQQEAKAQTAVDQSLDKIDAAMDTLGIESNTDGEPVE
ncbi:MAG: hypothetical protein DRP56_10510, partial [Planctomycetota bacterium]